jgi:hypothetical protein
VAQLCARSISATISSPASRSARPCAGGADFLFTAKPDSHKTLYDFMQCAACEELSQTRREGAKKLAYRYRWFKAGAPARGQGRAPRGLDRSDDLRRQREARPRRCLRHLARGHARDVVEIAACARARWKIENESFNVLKNNGCHLEHNFGHGKQNLAILFAVMNLLAFAMHTVCDCVEDLWIKRRNAKRARKRFFEHIRTITEYLVFPDWKTLTTTLITSKPPPEVENKFGQLCT